MKIHPEKETENSIKTKKHEIVQKKLQGELASQLQHFFQNVMEDEDITKEMHNTVHASLQMGTPGALLWPCQVLATLLWVVPSLPTAFASQSCIGYQLLLCLSNPPLRNLPIQSCAPETPDGLPILFSVGVRTEGQVPVARVPKACSSIWYKLRSALLSLSVVMLGFARNQRRTAEGLAGSY